MRMMMSGNRELVDAEAAELEELRSEIEAMRAKFQEMRMERMPEQDQIAEIARQASGTGMAPQPSQPRSRIHRVAPGDLE